MWSVLTVMKTLSSKPDERLELILFPFKAYVTMGAPFLWICEFVHGVLRSQYYGNPGGALQAVFKGYAISTAALLFGAIWQNFTRRGGCAPQTWKFLIASVILLLSLAFLFSPHPEAGR